MSILCVRCIKPVFALLLLCSLCASAQEQVRPNGTTESIPVFQVATIKASKPDETLRIQIVGHRFSTTGTSMIDILKYAYGVHASQITSGPEWIRTEKFDLLADPETEQRPTSDVMKKMVQQLVAERFQFSFHRDRKELPVYAIVPGKTEPRLTKSKHDDPNVIPAVGFAPSGRLSAQNATLADFATFLQRYVLDRPVVDETGITGRYDVDLKWTPDESPSGGTGSGGTGRSQPEDAGGPPGLYTAFQEQLGLKLNATKAVVEVFVVDHVEHPSEN
jgi:uncharacterized protein (TIGR03435 family)